MMAATGWSVVTSLVRVDQSGLDRTCQSHISVLVIGSHFVDDDKVLIILLLLLTPGDMIWYWSKMEKITTASLIRDLSWNAWLNFACHAIVAVSYRYRTEKVVRSHLYLPSQYHPHKLKLSRCVCFEVHTFIGAGFTPQNSAYRCFSIQFLTMFWPS